jgi:hypothetical protein
LYNSGPFGAEGAPNASAAAAYIDAVRALFRETKLGAPSARVIGYSQASSAVGEWRTGLTDVEAIVADGASNFGVFGAILILKRSFHQDRLGTNIGKTRKGELFSAGYMDAYIDQSWSGAWEDVPTRHSTGLGWTHQLGYILAHRAQIEGGNINRSQLAQPPCSGCSKRAKHYVLHDTFDSYEGWDTLDNVPLKLTWVRETASFFVFYLCLSRACLGK